MDKAKAAVSEFMHKAGHHDTTVHEKVAPAVVNEHILKTKHEEAQTAVDREIHQHHYHTSVQPVKDKEVLPEQHLHRMQPVEVREIKHGNDAEVRARLEREAAQFRDQRIEGETRVTSSAAPTIAGEHVHHHVHETIQPVIQKEVIQPTVVHTTIPVHEIQYNEPKHHATSALPAVSMAEFQRQGGVLTGREERVDGFEGEPRAVGSTLSGNSTARVPGTTDHHHRSRSSSNERHTHHSSNTTAKPSMAAKLDPRVDSDGDGKRGFMK